LFRFSHDHSMVYIASWQEYQEAAETLYAKSPRRTRYCVKWKTSPEHGGQLVLKITDDVTCLKYKTHSSIILNRFEALNLSLIKKMQNQRPAVEAPATSASTPGHPAVDSAAQQSSTAATPSLSGTTGGAVKKKKQKKKK